MQEVIDAHRNVAKQDPDSVQLNAMYQSLNADQKRVVDRVVDKIAVDEKIHLLISGQAGTGKSLVIDVINRMVSMQIQWNQLLISCCNSSNRPGCIQCWWYHSSPSVMLTC